MGVELRGQENSGHDGDEYQVGHNDAVGTAGWTPCLADSAAAARPFTSGNFATGRWRGVVKRLGGGVKKVLRNCRLAIADWEIKGAPALIGTLGIFAFVPNAIMCINPED